MRFVRSLLLSLFVLAFTAALLAQSSTSTLQGTVTDPKGATIPKASVELSDPAKAFTRTTQTDDNGVYRFTQTPPGTYTVTVNAPGFAASKKELQLVVN